MGGIEKLLAGMRASSTGLTIERTRIDTIAENIANANSTARTPEEEPYRRKIPTFKSHFDKELGVEKVELGKVAEDSSDFKSTYMPGHPAADEKGYVLQPNVNTLIETTDMREAQRSYEANLNVIESTRRMLQRTIDILRA